MKNEAIFGQKVLVFKIESQLKSCCWKLWSSSQNSTFYNVQVLNSWHALIYLFQGHSVLIKIWTQLEGLRLQEEKKENRINLSKCVIRQWARPEVPQSQVQVMKLFIEAGHLTSSLCHVHIISCHSITMINNLM